MGVPIYQVDAFAAEPFRGNPAGVCLLGADVPAERMRAVAGEMVPGGSPIAFETKSGGLAATRSGDRIELDFPSEAPEPVTAEDDLLRALGVDSVRYVGRNRMDLLVELGGEDRVRPATGVGRSGRADPRVGPRAKTERIPSTDRDTEER